MATSHTPSLHQLRHNRPGNVVILPTAQERQVKQQYGRAYVKAKHELMADQAVQFPFVWPAMREAQRKHEAQSLASRPDVPRFDPANPAHVRAWISLWDFGQVSRPPDGEGTSR